MAQAELNLRDYWLILRKRRWLASVAFVSVMLSTVFYTNSQVPVYSANASVRIIERRTTSGLLEEFLTWGIMGDPMLSQTKVIRSHVVMEAAARRLGWVDENSSDEEIALLARELQGMLDIAVIEDTNVINVRVESTDPVETAAIANAVAAAYREYNLLEKSDQARALREFTERQLGEVEGQLAGLENSLRLFRKQGEARGLAFSIIERIAHLKADRGKILRKYTALHPNVREMDERIAVLEGELGTVPDIELEYAQILRERDVLAESYRRLRTKFDEARLAEAEKVSDITIVNPATVPTGPIRPNRSLNYLLGLLVGVTFSLVSAFLIEHLDTSIGTIEDVEQYLELPVLGVIPYLHPPESSSQEFSWLTEIRQYFMPRKPHRRAVDRLREQTLIQYPSKSRVTDAFRLLRTNVRLEMFGNDLNHRIMMITSAGPDEGKTIISCNLAIAFAQEGRRTLLVDADLRRPHVHTCLGFRKREPGLTNILMDTCSPEQAVQTFVELMMGKVGFDAAIQTPGLDNLSVIAAGSTVDSPPDLLESKALARFLQWAREQYDLVIIDSAPVLAVADPILLAPRVEAVALVYKVGKTARRAIQRSKLHLESIKARVGGIILNNISPEVELESGYYYRQYRYPYEQAAKEERLAGKG